MWFGGVLAIVGVVTNNSNSVVDDNTNMQQNRRWAGCYPRLC
jgi:hypothetical protein